ncbi:MAG: hypothetical protein A2Y95_12970 [Deltaproteobacteria bacterium RBG_13_65_10]|nr:MAG: hypothetical protein A2Y95_12970 [Deltaproteobacteria bacterium RBG_13_65_10]
MIPDAPRAVRGRVSAAAAVLAYDEDARTYLGGTLKRQGIVPVDVWIRNECARAIVLDLQATRLLLVSQGMYDLTSGEKARKKAKKSVLSAAGWVSILAGPLLPLAVAASYVQISNVNKEIKRDYAMKAFPTDRPIPPQGEARGILFFQVPYKAAKNARASDYRVALVTRDTRTGALQKFEFGVPPPPSGKPRKLNEPFWKTLISP